MSFDAAEIPRLIYQGETAQWTKTLSDYAAPDWDSRYELTGSADGLTVTGVDDGSDHDFEITATESDALPPGAYNWALHVDHADGRTFVVVDGSLEILAKRDGAIPTTDARTHAERMLDGLESFLEGKMSTSDAESWAIGNRSVTRYKLEDLERMRRNYRAEVAIERRAQQRLRGRSDAGRVAVRFP